MTSSSAPRWRYQRRTESKQSDDTEPSDDTPPTDDTEPSDDTEPTDDQSLVPVPVTHPDVRRSRARRDSNLTPAVLKRTRQDRRELRSPSSWNESAAMEDGGLVIVDERGEVRHVAPGPVTSSLRYFVTRLQQDGSGAVPERVAFTSALSGEGVTFIANSFAAVLAHDLRRHVCIVDVNWWPSDDDDGTEHGDEPGILDVMHQDLELTEVLIQTESPNLSILPAGRAPVSIRPALARDRELAKLLAELDRHFDHLVLDLPAVLVSSDAVALADLADGVGLVVQQGAATRAQLAGALEKLGRDRSFGVILNRTRSSIPRLVRRLVGL